MFLDTQWHFFFCMWWTRRKYSCDLSMCHNSWFIHSQRYRNNYTYLNSFSLEVLSKNSSNVICLVHSKFSLLNLLTISLVLYILLSSFPYPLALGGDQPCHLCYFSVAYTVFHWVHSLIFKQILSVFFLILGSDLDSHSVMPNFLRTIVSGTNPTCRTKVS